MTAEIDEQHERDDHQRRVQRRSGQGRAARCRRSRRGRTARPAASSRSSRPARCRRRRGWPRRSRTTDAEQQADRQVGRRRMERMAQPAPVEQVLDRPDRPEEGRDPAVVEFAERSRPAVVERHEASQQSSHGVSPPFETVRRAEVGGCRAGASPQTVHIGGKLGDKVDGSGGKFVDKAVVAAWRWRLHFVLPEGAGANRQNRTGERSSGRSREPGSRVARPANEVLGRHPETPDLFGAEGRSTGRSSHQFLRALSCARACARLPAGRPALR